VRAFVLLALLVSALAPLADAQAFLSSGTVTMTIRPPPDPIVPLGPATEIPMTVRVACDATYVGQPISLALSVTRAPAWAAVHVSPATASLDSTTCLQEGEADLPATVSVSTTDMAPAFVNTFIQIAARADSAAHATGTGQVEFPIAADYFSVVVVDAPVGQVAVPAGGIATVPIKVVNLGNANTKVSFETTVSGDDVVAPFPAPVILQSRQAGGTQTAQVIPFVVQRAPGSTATGIERVTVHWTSSYALDGNLRGDSGSRSFLVLPGSGSPSDPPQDLQSLEHRVPAPGLGLVALGVVAVALVARRWAR